MSKFIRNWIIVFVVLFLIDFVWHGAIFKGYYTSQLIDFARSSSGKLAGLVQYMIIADLLASLAYSYFVPARSSADGAYLKNTIVLALIVVGFYAFTNAALIDGWGFGVVLADLAYAIVAGAVVGFVIRRLNAPKPASTVVT